MRRFFVSLVMLLLLVIPAAASDAPYSDLKLDVSGGVLGFAVKTTLPKGRTVSVWIHQVTAQSKALYAAVPVHYPQDQEIVVLDGKLMGNFPSTREYGLKSGTYELVFTTPATGKQTQSHRFRVTLQDDIPAQGWKPPEKNWNATSNTPRIPASEFRQRLVDAAKKLNVSGFNKLPEPDIGEKGAVIKIQSWLFSLTPLDEARQGTTLSCTVFYDDESMAAVQKRLADVYHVLIAIMSPELNKKERTDIIKKSGYYGKGGSTERNGLTYKTSLFNIQGADAVSISIAPTE